MKKTLLILMSLSTLLHDDSMSSVSASSSYFKITFGKDQNKASLKKEFFLCDRDAFCTNVVKTKEGEYATVNSESKLKELKDIACVWKKIKNIEGKCFIRLLDSILIHFRET